jgi:hypothetical protein
MPLECTTTFVGEASPSFFAFPAASPSDAATYRAAAGVSGRVGACADERRCWRWLQASIACFSEVPAAGAGLTESSTLVGGEPTPSIVDRPSRSLSRQQTSCHRVRPEWVGRKSITPRGQGLGLGLLVGLCSGFSTRSLQAGAERKRPLPLLWTGSFCGPFLPGLLPGLRPLGGVWGCGVWDCVGCLFKRWMRERWFLSIH